MTYEFVENNTHYAATNASVVNVTPFNVVANKTLANVNVVYIKELDKNVTVTDGKGSFEYLAGVEGIYNLTYIFDENATHYAVTNMSFVNVTDFNVSVNKTLITTDVIYVGSEDVEFYIVVTNNGNYTIDRVVVFDDNHTGLVLTSGSYGSWTYNGSAWIYDGSLAAGQSASLLVKFNATDAGNYTNYVVVDLFKSFASYIFCASL